MGEWKKAIVNETDALEKNNEKTTNWFYERSFLIG